MLSLLKKNYLSLFKKHQLIALDYKVNAIPRSGYSRPTNKILLDNINCNRNIYLDILNSFLKYQDKILMIKDAKVEDNNFNPVWNNNFLPGLDIIAIYGMISKFKPIKYIEIGSGNSTKVAKKAIIEQKLSTKIISIDPFPRVDIDQLADQIIRHPFEDLNDFNFILNELNENDILFIDNSHRVFPNSDAMIAFLEILPYLKKGVIVHFHDIYLPFDYPKFMCDRFYNEQYLLAAFIISNPKKYKTILPNYFISRDKELSAVLYPIWNNLNLKHVEKHGGSFWLQIQ